MADNKAANAKGKPMTKSAVYQELADETKLTRKQITDVFEALAKLVKRELGKKGPGIFTVPNSLIKVKLSRRPATKARMGRNPATGAPMQIKAKPARTVVKAQALKSLKEMVK
jgi:nucleoid DNA-binding protein